MCGTMTLSYWVRAALRATKITNQVTYKRFLLPLNLDNELGIKKHHKMREFMRRSRKTKKP